MAGLTHIYCGDGKGKTTAAIGLGIRACGSNQQVLFVQFLKGNTSSELNILRNLPNFKVLGTPPAIKFTFQMNEQELQQTALLCTQLFQKAIDCAISEKCDMLIFDEIFGALSCNLLDYNTVFSFIENKPANLELVLTGRNPPQQMVELADYVSEMKKIKHPYEKGIPARKGIEY